MMETTSGANSEEQALRFAKERMSGFGAQDVMEKGQPGILAVFLNPFMAG